MIIQGQTEAEQLRGEVRNVENPPGITPEKYQVVDQRGRKLEYDEYFVLRRGDALAISTLRSYAANAMTLLDLERIGVLPLTMAQKQHLMILADDVVNMAYNWEDDDEIKLPD